MSEHFRSPNYIHIGCGARIEWIMLSDRAGYKMNCPRHPGQERYAVREKRSLEDMPWILLCYLAVGIALFSGYLFYFADCETVRTYWMLTHVPGRCL